MKMSDILETVRSEDFVEYYLYLTEDSPKECLQEIYNKIHSSYASLIEDYIWHKDAFYLNKVPDPEENTPPHLYGIVYFGDNIEDEWYIVNLLIKISESFNDVFIKVIDSDGEFLLIEAANDLPKWMKPENCCDQIFIHKGAIRFSASSIVTKRSASIKATINQLKEIKEPSPIEQTITKSIIQRTQKYNNGVNDLLHKSRVYVPAKVAALLDAKPNLIASAVTAFCQRDIIDTRVCKNMENFPPEEMVLRNVTFTKFLYAMISRQKIQPERKSTWKLPPLSSLNYKEHHLGFKITCGFEILASRCSEKSKSDLKLSKKWNQYLQVLKRKGYFKDLLEGSKEYVDLEKRARIYFLDNVGTEEPENNAIINFLHTISYDVEKMKQEENEIPPSDDEKWMEINEEEFNKLLEERFGMKGINVTNCPEILSSTINKFLNQASDLEGVDFKNNSNFNAMDIDESRQNSVLFDPNSFTSSLEKMLDILKLDKPLNYKDNESDDSDDYESENENEDDNTEDQNIKLYMDLMDKELTTSSLSESFVKKTDSQNKSNGVNPVDIDMNALTNILKSYEEEFGGSGPAGNLLHSLGLKLNCAKND